MILRNIITLIITLIALLIALDSIWLYVRSDYHSTFFSSVQGTPLRVRFIPAAIVYVLLALATLYVAILPAKSAASAALRGAAVGAIMYGFYDATNLATLRNWTWEMAIADTLWGSIACSLASYIMYRYTTY